MIDLDALEESIADGERRNLFVAPLVKDLIAELRAARVEMHALRVMAEEAAHAENLNAADLRMERAAVVAWLRRQADVHVYGEGPLHVQADIIERGEHRREEKP